MGRRAGGPVQASSSALTAAPSAQANFVRRGRQASASAASSSSDSVWIRSCAGWPARAASATRRAPSRASRGAWPRNARERPSFMGLYELHAGQPPKDPDDQHFYVLFRNVVANLEGGGSKGMGSMFGF